MTPVADYEDRLAKYASGLVSKPFVWGQTDCVALAARAVDCIYGTNWFANVVTWESESEAREACARMSVEQYLEAQGATQVDTQAAVTGDILVGVHDDLWTVYVVTGTHVLSSMPDRGVILLRLRDLSGLTLHCWRL